jgi:hypothetical protein
MYQVNFNHLPTKKLIAMLPALVEVERNTKNAVENRKKCKIMSCELGLYEGFYFVQKSSYLLFFFNVAATCGCHFELTARVTATPILLNDKA